MSRRFAILLVSLVPLQAGIIIGTVDPGIGNADPFGAPISPAFPGTVYQQAYAASDFNGIIDITNIEFFRTQIGDPNALVNDATYTIKLSYSANPVNGLDTVTFANNVGAGQVTFGTYVLSGFRQDNGLTFIENNSDFVYNPSNGPLLVEIDLSSIGALGFAASNDAMNGTAGGLFSRAQNFSDGFNDYGLVTGFDSAAPEPATLGLLSGGLIGLAFLGRRRTHSRVSPPSQ